MTSLSFLSSPSTADRRRWLSLAVVCLAQLMITLDTTIVNVALHSIQQNLHFTEGALTWVINAFLITFGSFLLLAGRLGDLVGRKRVFLVGVTIFTLASGLCGLAPTAGVLILARLIQGFGAALQASVILAIIVTEFPEPAERAKAMSSYVFTAVAGGSLGLMAGGVLTQLLDWHWIFFVNLPIGIVTVALGRVLIPDDSGLGISAGIDWLGAVLATAAVASAVYSIVQVSSHALTSASVLAPAALAVALLVSFLVTESRAPQPMMPLRILRLRGLIGSSLVRGFLVTGMYATFFLGTLYMERILHYNALQAGLSFLPWTITVALLSALGLTAKLVERFGAVRVLTAGMLAVIAGLLLLHASTTTTAFFPLLFAAYFLVGLGIGSAFMPLLQIAMADVPAVDAGLGSGIVNVSQQVSAALGLALIGTLATDHTKALQTAHAPLSGALLGGYHLGFMVGVASVALGLAIALVVLRPATAEAVTAEVDTGDVEPSRTAVVAP